MLQGIASRGPLVSLDFHSGDRYSHFDDRSRKDQGIVQGAVRSSPFEGISILQYTDDTFLFGGNDIEESLDLRWILNCFER